MCYGVPLGGTLLPLVEPVALKAEQDEPVDLWGQDAQASQVGVDGHVERDGVERKAVMCSVHPVHVGEESDAAQEEAQEHHAAVQFVQPALLQTQLQVRERNINTVRLLQRMREQKDAVFF